MGGFADLGSRNFENNRNLLRKKEPFQRIKENHFINVGKLEVEITKSFLEELQKEKYKRKKREVVFKLTTLAVLLIVVLTLIKTFIL